DCPVHPSNPGLPSSLLLTDKLPILLDREPISFLLAAKFTEVFQATGPSNTSAPIIISTPLLVMDAPLASKRLNWYGGVGTLYSYNRSLVSLSYTSIDPFILPSNKAKSIPALIMVVVSHFRSGLGFCTTEKLLTNSPLYKNWSPCGPYKVRDLYGGMF